MSAGFHINTRTSKVGICRATKIGCPLKDDAIHDTDDKPFESREAAGNRLAAFEKERDGGTALKGQRKTADSSNLPEIEENSSTSDTSEIADRTSETSDNTSRNFTQLPAATELGFSDANKERWTAPRGKLMDWSIKVFQEQTRIIGKLSPKSRTALKKYMGQEVYYKLNETLRNNNGVDNGHLSVPGWTSENVSKLVEDLDEAIAEGSKNKASISYRGVPGKFASELASSPIGSRIEMAGYTSTTSLDSIVSQFSGNHTFNQAKDSEDLTKLVETVESGSGEKVGPAMVKLEMMTDKGIFLSGTEQEKLLPRNTRWRIAGKRLVEVKRPGSSSSEHILCVQMIDEDLLED